MVCKITSIRGRRQGQRGTTLIETSFGLLLLSLLLLVVMTFFIYSSWSFAALYNYVDLDDVNRIAVDNLTRDIRQANKVISFTQTKLVLEDWDGKTLTYEYLGDQKRLLRTKEAATRIMLSECQWLKFVVDQRNTIASTFDQFDAAKPDTAKVINVSWLCSRVLEPHRNTTESVQTAKIVIRKQAL